MVELIMMVVFCYQPLSLYDECITSGIKMRSKQLAKLSKKYQDEENLFHQTVTREGEEK